jgi:hypothetical protein
MSMVVASRVREEASCKMNESYLFSSKKECLRFSSLEKDLHSSVDFKMFHYTYFHQFTQCLRIRDVSLDIILDGKVERVWVSVKSLSNGLFFSRKEIIDSYKQGCLQGLIKETLERSLEVKEAHKSLRSGVGLRCFSIFDYESYDPGGIFLPGKRDMWELGTFSPESNRPFYRLFDPGSKRIFLVEGFYSEKVMLNSDPMRLVMILRKNGIAVDGLPRYIGYGREEIRGKFTADDEYNPHYLLIDNYDEDLCCAQSSLSPGELVQGLCQVLNAVFHLERLGFFYANIKPSDILVNKSNLKFALVKFNNLFTCDDVTKKITEKKFLTSFGVDIGYRFIRQDIKNIRDFIKDERLGLIQKSKHIQKSLKDILVVSFIRKYIEELVITTPDLEESLYVWISLWEHVMGDCDDDRAHDLFLSVGLLKMGFCKESILVLLKVSSSVRIRRMCLTEAIKILKKQDTFEKELSQWDSMDFWKDFSSGLAVFLDEETFEGMSYYLKSLEDSSCLDTTSVRIIQRLAELNVKFTLEEFCYYMEEKSIDLELKKELFRVLDRSNYSPRGSVKDICNEALAISEKRSLRKCRVQIVS